MWGWKLISDYSRFWQKYGQYSGTKLLFSEDLFENVMIPGKILIKPYNTLQYIFFKSDKSWEAKTPGNQNKG